MPSALPVTLLALVLASAMSAQTQWRRIDGPQPMFTLPQASMPLKGVADLDGDGFPEILAGDPVRFAWNPMPRWAAFLWYPLEPTGGTAATANAVVAADLDGDGDLDVLLLRGSGTAADPNFVNTLLVNDGHAGFTDETAQRWPTGAYATMDAAVADFDGDGRVDILECNQYAQHRLFLGQPGGTFVDATATHMPPITGGRGIAIGDLDGNGSIDAVLAAGDPSGCDYLLLNDGSGHFTDASSRLAGRAEDRGVALADVDGDGDLDLVCAVSSMTASSELLRNNGTGLFTPDPAGIPASTTSDSHATVDAVDLDGDGDLDLLFGYASASLANTRLLFFNDGAGQFTHVPDNAALQGASNDRFRRFVAADLDGDADLDLAGSAESTWPSTVKLFYGLDRQLSGPIYALPGTTCTIMFDGQANAPGVLGLSFDYVSLPLGPVGTLHLLPGGYALWHLLAVLDQTGRGSLVLPVPNDPRLYGLPFCLQGLTFARRSASLTLTNAMIY